MRYNVKYNYNIKILFKHYKFLYKKRFVCFMFQLKKY